MSKILTVLLILLISQLPPIIIKTQAIGETTACTDPSVGITYGNPANGTSGANTFFLENSGDLTLEFTIASNNILNGKEVFLHLPGGIGGSDNKNTPSVIATSPKFRLVIDKSYSQAQKGAHEGNLYWPNPVTSGQFVNFCSQIKYTVGSNGGACTILSNPPVPSKVRVNTSLTIAFLGIANKLYQLDAGSRGKISQTTTDPQGIGTFQNVAIPGNVGDSYRLIIYVPVPISSEKSQCDTIITITANAPPQPTVNPVPINPIPAPLSLCANSQCNGSGGIPCGTDTDPAIATAIGCIHTSPAEFVKDLLTFVIGISGGLAFLMMLLGAFQMLTSAGNPETLNAGKDRLTSAVIGLLFIIFAVLLLQIIGVGILSIPEFK